MDGPELGQHHHSSKKATCRSDTEKLRKEVKTYKQKSKRQCRKLNCLKRQPIVQQLDEQSKSVRELNLKMLKMKHS